MIRNLGQPGSKDLLWLWLQGLQSCCARRWSKTAAGGNFGRTSSHATGLHFGSYRPAGYCDVNPRTYPDSLLASHPVERALAVALEPLLVVVLGPTGSGKTALSLALAERFQGEIVNCDSVAMYREFEIGTAKPTAAERARAAHHLLDVVEPTGYITAGEYARQGREVWEEIKQRKLLAVVVGGTGLHLRALLDGLSPGPRRSEELRERLRAKAEGKGTSHLHRILTRMDREASDKIHANDLPKLIRAIEVCLSSRHKMTEMWQQGREPLGGFRILRIGLSPERDALYGRINERARHMFTAGLVEETRRLLDKYGENAGPLGSLGYKQAKQLVRGEMDENAALQAAQQAHRNYAKRQMTWFRREPEVCWLTGFGDEMGIQQSAVKLVEDRLEVG